MNVVSAWREGITGKGIVVTILDDGLEKDHPDLILNYVSTTQLKIHFFRKSESKFTPSARNKSPTRNIKPTRRQLASRFTFLL